ncbi:MAG: hypothetical protein ACYDBQ_09890 [Thermoplasmatota archaeon]
MRAWVVLAPLFVAGCLQGPSAPTGAAAADLCSPSCPDPVLTYHNCHGSNGTGWSFPTCTFTVTPGTPTALAATFLNEGQPVRNPESHQCSEPFAPSGVRVGHRPLELAAPGLSRVEPEGEIDAFSGGGGGLRCNLGPVLETGMRVNDTLLWTGALPLFDYNGLQNGTGFHLRTFWAAAGKWPVTAPYWTDLNGTERSASAAVAVARNDLNWDSDVGLASCRWAESGNESATPAITSARLTSDREKAQPGQVIGFNLSYTVTFPFLGCWIGTGGPSLTVDNGNGFGCSSEVGGPDMPDGLFHLTVRQHNVTFGARFELTGPGCGNSPGPANVHFAVALQPLKARPSNGNQPEPPMTPVSAGFRWQVPPSATPIAVLWGT